MFALVCPLVCPKAARAQEANPREQRLEIRVGAKAEGDILDDLKASADLEMRTDGWNPDQYQIEPDLRYKPSDYFSARASFRFFLEGKGGAIDHGYRPRFAIYGHLPLGDFEFDTRLQYTHEFGLERDIERRLRYLGGLEWDVPKAKLDFSIKVEAFQNLPDGVLVKMRYGIDGEFRFYGSKGFDQWLSLGYMVDYYLDRPRNRHMPVIKYTAEFE